MKVLRTILPPLKLDAEKIDLAPNAEADVLRCAFCETTSHQRPFRVLVPDDAPEPEDRIVGGQGKTVEGEIVVCAVCYEIGMVDAAASDSPTTFQRRVDLAAGFNRLLDDLRKDYGAGPLPRFSNDADAFRRIERVREFDDLAIADARESAPEGETDTAFWARVEAVRPGIVNRRNPFVRALDQVGPLEDVPPSPDVAEAWKERRAKAPFQPSESPVFAVLTIVVAILFAVFVLDRCFPTT